MCDWITALLINDFSQILNYFYLFCRVRYNDDFKVICPPRLQTKFPKLIQIFVSWYRLHFVSFPLFFIFKNDFCFLFQKKKDRVQQSHKRTRVTHFFIGLTFQHIFALWMSIQIGEKLVCLQTMGAAIEQKTLSVGTQPIWFNSQLLLDTFGSLLATICMFLQLTIYWSQFVSKCAISKQ